MQAFEITTQTSELLPLDREGRGEVKFVVTNRSGRRLRARVSVEPEGPEGIGLRWVTTDKSEHGFAPGGALVVTASAAVPAGTAPGDYSFRLVLTEIDGDEPAVSRGKPVALRYDKGARPLLLALAMGCALLAAASVFVYQFWLATPECEMPRAFYDHTQERCVCPPGTGESLLGEQRICLCALGSDYDPDTESCAPRSCEAGRAMFAEAAGACTCPPGTSEETVGGAAQCVCPVGQAFDESARACAERACDSPVNARYDERVGGCSCPAGTTEQVESDPESDTERAVCRCPAGQDFLVAEQRCGALPNLVLGAPHAYPPLRDGRQFTIELNIENQGEFAAGPFVLEVELSGAGLKTTLRQEYAGLQPGEAHIYESEPLRVGSSQPLQVKATVLPQGYEELPSDDNSVSQEFGINLRDPEERSL
ncbi:hypothetical protein [Haliangium ochraceum]|uniref:CARDB domain-containing protein n=1 Tax=Haliangium ochraceum (strain DSM 14365 / JCM 11303 / SMP-2) TaxID=502025 RepID=D0LRU8_HALO1|nr:hypothetical protein [Haliangium ochraceum]ACY19090.1 hypothetical protein Hoch_6624 [Haliangium ochraceum DSM 14365]